MSRCSKTIFDGHTVLNIEKKAKEKYIEFDTFINDIYDYPNNYF